MCEPKAGSVLWLVLKKSFFAVDMIEDATKNDLPSRISLLHIDAMGRYCTTKEVCLGSEEADHGRHKQVGSNLKEQAFVAIVLHCRQRPA